MRDWSPVQLSGPHHAPSSIYNYSATDWLLQECLRKLQKKNYSSLLADCMLCQQENRGLMSKQVLPECP